MMHLGPQVRRDETTDHLSLQSHHCDSSFMCLLPRPREVLGWPRPRVVLDWPRPRPREVLGWPRPRPREVLGWPRPRPREVLGWPRPRPREVLGWPRPRPREVLGWPLTLYNLSLRLDPPFVRLPLDSYFRSCSPRMNPARRAWVYFLMNVLTTLSTVASSSSGYLSIHTALNMPMWSVDCWIWVLIIWGK